MRTDKERLPGRVLAFQQRFDDKRDADWAVGMPFVPRSLLGSGVRAIRHRSRQLSNLIKQVMKYRAAGFKPSKANVAAIIQALNYRPNKKPLIDALNDTLAYQSKINAQSDLLQQAQAAKNPNNAVMGAGQMPSDGNPVIGGGQPAAPPAAPITP